MIIKTGRFGELKIEEQEIIHFPHGMLGFVGETQFCLVDPGDDTLILWLQSIKTPGLAFPCLEPKIFKPEYTVRLSNSEMRELGMTSLKGASVLSIITIPEDVTQMTANLKAPVVINLVTQTARQVILQENEYVVQHPIFKELRTHLLTIKALRVRVKPGIWPVRVSEIQSVDFVKGL